MTSDAPVRIALVGGGAFGAKHAAGLRRIDGAEVVAVASQLETVGRDGNLARGPLLYESLACHVRALAQAITDGTASTPSA